MTWAALAAHMTWAAAPARPSAPQPVGRAGSPDAPDQGAARRELPHGVWRASGPQCRSRTTRRAACRRTRRTAPSRGITMGLLTKPIKTLDDLFVHTLQDIYYAEQHITKALPKMISKVTNPELKQGLQSHLEQTRGH